MTAREALEADLRAAEFMVFTLLAWWGCFLPNEQPSGFVGDGLVEELLAIQRKKAN